jgi:hypothetical protein
MADPLQHVPIITYEEVANANAQIAMITSPASCRALRSTTGATSATSSPAEKLQGPVDMVIPNTSLAECEFEMFNKQPAGYLYQVLPKFGASELFIKSLLRRSMEAGVTDEAPLCTYDFDMHVLTTPRDEAQEGVLSDVRSLPFFQDVLAKKLAANASKKNKKAYTAPEMCFQLGSAHSVQTVHGATEGNSNTVPAPGVELRPAGTTASTANPSNADQPVVEIASSKDDASSMEESEGSDDYTTPSSDDLSASSSSVEEDEQSMPAGGG